jgi:RNA polymerase sigma-B factor
MSPRLERPTGTEPRARNRRRTERELIRRSQAGDRRARDALVTALLPLARCRARRYDGGSETIEDLVQVACIGVMKAIDRFDPARRTALSTYVVPFVDGELKHHLRDNLGAFHLPRGTQERVIKVSRIAESLAGQLGRAPSAEEVAPRAGLTAQDAVATLELAAAQRPQSLEAGARAEMPALGDRVGREDERLGLVEDRDLLALALSSLDERERKVLLLRVGGDWSHREVGEWLGISARHASRLLHRAVARARAAAGDAEFRGAEANGEAAWRKRDRRRADRQ